MTILFIIYQGTTILFSITAAPFYSPTSRARVCQYLHILISVYYFLGLFGRWWFLVLVLFFVFCFFCLFVCYSSNPNGYEVVRITDFYYQILYWDFMYHFCLNIPFCDYDSKNLIVLMFFMKPRVFQNGCHIKNGIS